jgi:hypothetical protein
VCNEISLQPPGPGHRARWSDIAAFSSFSLPQRCCSRIATPSKTLFMMIQSCVDRGHARTFCCPPISANHNKSTQNSRLDRSDSQLRREWRSGETAFCLCRVPHQPATKTTGAPSFAVSPRRVGCNASTSHNAFAFASGFLPLPFLPLLLPMPSPVLLHPIPQNRHLDRRDSQLHRESRGGETPAFRFLAFVLLLAIAPVLAVGIRAALSAPRPARPRATTALPPGTSNGTSVARAESRGRSD